MPAPEPTADKLKPVVNPEDGERGGEDYGITEIVTETLGSIPTRVIVVEELANCGVISRKKAKKRIMQIMDEMELKSIVVETLQTEPVPDDGA